MPWESLAPGSGVLTVRVWDVDAAKEVLIYSKHEGEVDAPAIWRPGKCTASAGDDQAVHI